MKCKEIQAQMVAYLFEEIEPTLKEKLECHLKDCPSCRAELESLQRTTEALQRWPDLEPEGRLIFVEREPLSLWSQILTGVWVRRLFSRRSLSKLAVGVAVAMAVLFALSAEVSYQGGEFSFRTGWKKSPQESTPVISPEVVDLLRQFQQEIQRENLYAMRRLIEESEQRQQEALWLALTGLAKELERQRLEDLKLISENLGWLQHRTEKQIGQTNTLLRGLLEYASMSQQP